MIQGALVQGSGLGVAAHIARTFNVTFREASDLTEVSELVGVIFDVGEIDDDVTTAGIHIPARIVIH